MSIVRPFCLSELNTFSDCCRDEEIIANSESRRNTYKVAMVMLNQINMEASGEVNKFSLFHSLENRQIDVLHIEALSAISIAGVVVKSHKAAAAILDLYPQRHQEGIDEIIRQISSAQDPEALERVLRRVNIKEGRPSLDSEVSKALIATKKKLEGNPHVLHALLSTGNRPLECIHEASSESASFFSNIMAKDPATGKGNLLGLIYMLHRGAARSRIQSASFLHCYANPPASALLDSQLEREYDLLYKMGVLSLVDLKPQTPGGRPWNFDFSLMPVASAPLPFQHEQIKLCQAIWNHDIGVIIEQDGYGDFGGLRSLIAEEETLAIGPYTIMQKEAVEHYTEPHSSTLPGSFASGFFVSRLRILFEGQEKMLYHYHYITESAKSAASLQTVAALLEHYAYLKPSETHRYLILSNNQDMRAVFSLCFAKFIRPKSEMIDAARTLYSQDKNLPPLLSRQAFMLSYGAWEHYFANCSDPETEELNTSISSDSSDDTEKSLMLD